MTSNAVDNALDGNNSGSSQGIQGIPGSSSRLKGNLDSSQTRVNILVGASGTEDDGDSGSNNSNSNKNVNYNQKDRKHFHHHKRSRLPPKKLEVRTPSVQDLEKISACGASGGGKKIKIKNHQHHRAVWYFFTCKMVSP